MSSEQKHSRFTSLFIA